MPCSTRIFASESIELLELRGMMASLGIYILWKQRNQFDKKVEKSENL